MPIVSLNMRRSAYEAATPETVAVLATITHSALPAPVRLSTDPTERLRIDPETGWPVYGTVSNGHEYLFVLMSAVLPDEQRTTPPRAQLALDNVDADMVEVVRSFSNYADIDLAIVLVSDPSTIERSYAGMQIVSASYDADRVTLDIGREPFAREPWPYQRMTRSRFPGLWK